MFLQALPSARMYPHQQTTLGVYLGGPVKDWVKCPLADPFGSGMSHDRSDVEVHHYLEVKGGLQGRTYLAHALALTLIHVLNLACLTQVCDRPPSGPAFP
jgi:hypothetical protein